MRKIKISTFLIVLTCCWAYHNRKKIKKDFKKISWTSKIIEAASYWGFFREKNIKELIKEVIWIIFIEPLILVIKLLLKRVKQAVEIYTKSNKLNELRKSIMFAYTLSCNSSLLKWAGRKEILNKEQSDRIWELWMNINNYITTYVGNGTMYDIEKRMKLTDKDFKELSIRSQKVEKFIKEDLEKGTEWEGEFDEKNYFKYLKRYSN